MMMPMQLANVVQGSPEWLALRVNHPTASEAPAALGVSKYQKRTELLQQKHTGIAPDGDEFKQALFDRGHESEAQARSIAEEIVDGELYPVTCTREVDGLVLLASVDGLTLEGDAIFEHKLWSDELALLVDANSLPPHYTVQMDQQLLVTGARRCLFMTSDGTRDRMAWCWYESTKEKADALIAGWKQFYLDLENWKPEQPAALVAPVEVVTLPAVSVVVGGSLTVSSNFDAFGTRLRDFIAKLPKQPSSDEEFAQAESAVKTLEKAESAIGAAIDGAVAQTASLDDVVRLGGSLKELARSTRLALDKLVKARKDSIRGDLVAGGQAELDAHTKALNQRLMAAWGPGAAWMPRRIAPFGDAIKGKKTVASIKEAIGVMLANEKIDASAAADRLQVNRAALVIDGKDWIFLFADFASVGAGPTHLFSAVAEQRIRAHQEREAEAARKREEAEAAARSASNPPVLLQDEAEGGPLSEALSSKPDAPLQAREAAAAIASDATITLGDIKDRIAPLQITADGLAQLGFVAVGTKGSSRLYSASSWPAIKRALIARITEAA